jgi:hypothetical protein
MEESHSPQQPGAVAPAESAERAEDPARSALQRMIRGFRVSQMISVAAKLCLSDHLQDGPKSPRELAEKTGAHEGSLYRLLRTLAGMGIFAEEDGPRFRLTPSAEFLRSDVQGSLRVAAEVVSEEWMWRPWGSLLHGVMTGDTAFDHLYAKNTWDWFAEHPAAARLFDEFMDETSTAEARSVVAAFDFETARTVVDVAGGRGVLLEEILRRNPSAHGILFNLPQVIDSARHVIDTNLSRRMELISGDFFQVIPPGADTYILKNILHDWDDDRALKILVNCRRASKPDSLLLIIEHIVSAPNQPCLGKMVDMQMLVRNGGRNRTEQEFRALLIASGFHLARVIHTPGAPDVVVASLHE